ncbi:hypothetical protein POTOM_003256 [Populus tomentosa]|uniref:Disease resistance protein At4g27190-like leucine-rich repeats domain-containing protein n=1 Tax=Populus tomentosa TaxID=118781 RepID=A0A8X8DLE2_POPTO|nr:hypothetical protein POTOM_003256 [Populus tomentosa]
MSYKVGSALRFHGYDANSKVEVLSFIQISWLNAIREWQEEFVGNLNSILQLLISYSHALLPCLLGLRNLETLCLDSMHDMRCIWKGLVLSKLTILKGVKCKRLTHVFTCNMIVSLVQLKVLKILSYEELEQIIAKNDDENDQILLGDHHPSLCFPNLSHIEIRECNTLKSLFPVAMALSLPNLQIFIVGEPSRLVGVFGQEENALPVNVEKVMELLNLQNLKVFECPKLITIFAITPNGSIRAQSEVSEVAEDSITGCSAPISTYRTWTRNKGWEEGEVMISLAMESEKHAKQARLVEVIPTVSLAMGYKLLRIQSLVALRQSALFV